MVLCNTQGGNKMFADAEAGAALPCIFLPSGYGQCSLLVVSSPHYARQFQIVFAEFVLHVTLEAASIILATHNFPTPALSNVALLSKEGVFCDLCSPCVLICMYSR